MLGRLLKNVRLRCDWSLWWAVVGLATKMSRGAGEDHRGAGVDVRVAKIVRSDGCAHGVEGGPFSLWLREKSREVEDHHRGATTGSVVTKMSAGAGAVAAACGGHGASR